MKIIVINGSPKGDNSITLQTVNYLKLRFPAHTYTVIPAAAAIRRIEKEPAPVMKEISEADLLLFAYPVYTFLVPSQLHTFIELMKASGLDFSHCHVSQITTSKHFYDVTAHTFIEENMADLGCRVHRGLSADMADLTTQKGQTQAVGFFAHLLWQIQKENGETEETVLSDAAGKGLPPVMIVTDLSPEDDSLREMIRRFRKLLPLESHVVNLQKLKIRGGCLGCLNCATRGECIYKDDFQRALRLIQSGSAIVTAFSIRDHSMGFLFKRYDDRQFCNGHRTVTMGKPMGYLIDGDWSAERNLQTVVAARAECGGNLLAGIATNEKDSLRPAEGQIEALVRELCYALVNDYSLPANFYGVGGMKIFRDLIFQMQGVMKEDHKFFKAHGQYDFPQNHPGTILAMYAAGAMMDNPKLRKKLGDKISEGMLMPYTKVLQEAAQNEPQAPSADE